MAARCALRVIVKAFSGLTFFRRAPDGYARVADTFRAAAADFVVGFWSSASPQTADGTGAAVRITVAPRSVRTRCSAEKFTWPPSVTITFLKHAHSTIAG